MKKQILVFLTFLFVLQILSAGWPLAKYATCNMLNQTQEDCDMVWCNVIDCEYDVNKTACICIKEIIVNITQNISSQTLNAKGFYNKTEVEKLINNSINNTEKEFGNQTAKQYIDGQDMELRNNLVDRIEEESLKVIRLSKSEEAKSNDPPWWFLTLVLTLVAGVLCFMAWNKTKEEKTKEVRKKKAFTLNAKRFQGKKDNEETEEKIKEGKDGN